MSRSCEASLKRLKTDWVDLYLLHWMGSFPREETLRGFEFDLLPWCAKQKISIMAYSPVEQGRILGNPALTKVARRLGATPARVALAWTLRDPNVVSIPKAATAAHVRENRKALDLKLDAQALAELDKAFPPPKARGRWRCFESPWSTIRRGGFDEVPDRATPVEGGLQHFCAEPARLLVTRNDQAGSAGEYSKRNPRVPRSS